MVQKMFKLSLLVVAMMFSCEMFAKPKSKTFCNLAVLGNLCVRGNETINGNLVVGGTITCGGANICALAPLAAAVAAGATGAAGAPGTVGLPPLGTLVSSIVPFSSGILSVATTPLTPTAPLAMAFGSSSIVPVGVPATLIPTETGFAFTAPAAGTLHNLQVSLDSVYALNIAAPVPLTFTYTVMRSPCVAGTFSGYVATPLSATTTLPAGPLLSPLVEAPTECGSNAGSIPLAAGDRITINVTPSAAITGQLAFVAFSAGVMFSPA